jgi:hypothetical protein
MHLWDYHYPVIDALGTHGPSDGYECRNCGELAKALPFNEGHPGWRILHDGE